MSLLPCVAVDLSPHWKVRKLTGTIIDSSWLEGAYTMTGLCVKSYGKAIIRENFDIHVVLISTSQKVIFRNIFTFCFNIYRITRPKRSPISSPPIDQ